eukprot:4793850-Amphidinium_carterae.1
MSVYEQGQGVKFSCRRGGCMHNTPGGPCTTTMNGGATLQSDMLTFSLCAFSTFSLSRDNGREAGGLRPCRAGEV